MGDNNVKRTDEPTVGVAYVQTSKKGATYLRITMNVDSKAGDKFAMFKSNNKRGESDPDYYIKPSGQAKPGAEAAPKAKTPVVAAAKAAPGFPF